MSKTLGSIITLAGAVAVNVIPGLGQLASAAILLGTAAAGYAISSLGGPKASKPEQTEQSVKTERPARVKGYGETRRYPAVILYETSSAGKSVDIGAYHDGRAAAVTRIYLNDDQVTVVGNTVQTLPDKRYQSGHVKVAYRLGLSTEMAFGEAIDAFPGVWTPDHRGDGVVTALLLKEPEKEKYFLETYPQGDNVTLSLVGQWTPTYDPRDPAQSPYAPETWTWSANAVRAFVHYLMVERGFDWNNRFEPQRAAIVAAINDADTPQALAAGGTEPRYRTAVSYKATDTPAAVINSLLACFDGWYVINERQEVIVRSGRFYTPTVPIGPDQIVSYRHQAGVADEDKVNTISCPYVSDQHDFNTVDGEPWTDENDIAERGKEVTAQLDAVVPSHTQARRLAKRTMARKNADDRGSVTTTFAGRSVIGERYIHLTLREAGATFYDSPAEIVAVELEPSTGGVTFDWVAVDTNLDAWNPATEDGEGAGVGSRYAPQPLAAPTLGLITKDYGQNAAFGVAGVRLTIVASGGPTDATWYVRTRPLGDSAWLEQVYPDLDPSSTVTLQTDFLSVGEVEVEVAYGLADGRLSPWSAPTGGAVSTSNVLPGLIEHLSVTANTDGTLIAGDWDDTPFASRYLVEVIV